MHNFGITYLDYYQPQRKETFYFFTSFLAALWDAIIRSKKEQSQIL